MSKVALSELVRNNISDINLLFISNYLKQILAENNFKNISEINDFPISNLKQIKGIGVINARTIKIAAQKYIERQNKKNEDDFRLPRSILKLDIDHTDKLILYLLSQGEDIEAIAEKVSLKKRSVFNRLKNLREIFSAINNTHLIYMISSENYDLETQDHNKVKTFSRTL